MRTDKEIEAEIAKLEDLKKRVPATTMFGESNVEAIETQIIVIRGRLNEDDVFTKAEEEDWDDRTREHALEAAEWLEDKSKKMADDPEGWLSIAKKT